MRGGIEYIECVRWISIRSRPIGVERPAGAFPRPVYGLVRAGDAGRRCSSDELLCTRTNWNRVILEGA
ncbi:hypothetical protein LNP74_20880 [Klebsiella pneumoniae subsp. pneumoniae]|nr:hypothetical protein [Klebsiella pneumoniae subsp. pneumoniae]